MGMGPPGLLFHSHHLLRGFHCHPPARLVLRPPAPGTLPPPVGAPSLLGRSPDRQRSSTAPLLVLLRRRVTARAFVLVTVSSKWDHLEGHKGEVSPGQASALRLLACQQPCSSTNPLHLGTDRLWADVGVVVTAGLYAHQKTAPPWGVPSGSCNPRLRFVLSVFLFSNLHLKFCHWGQLESCAAKVKPSGELSPGGC